MADTTKFISYENLELYNALLKDVMSAEDAKALKVVTLSLDKKKLQFYKVGEPIGEDAEPAYEIELPTTDLSGVMAKVLSATNGHVGIFTDGTIIDSGVALEDLVTDQEVKEAIQQAILQSDHLSREIVTQLPEPDAAKRNVIYMIKDESIKEGDAYEEWMLIGDQLVQVGSTETDLTDYYTKEQADAKVAEAKTAAVSEATTAAAQDAQSKADKALQDAKAYTDTETAKVGGKVDTLQGTVNTLQETVTEMDTTVDSINDRVTALETSVPTIETATEDDIRKLFQ